MLVGDGRGLAATCHPQFGQDVRDVDAGGLGADVEQLGDLPIRTASGDQAEHLGLSVGQPEVAIGEPGHAADVETGCVFRMAKAYPVYDSAYVQYLATLKDYVNQFANLQTIGRNGLHRYNNQDHAMLTGMLAARNVALGERNDVWAVNTDSDYHEEIIEEVGPNEAATKPARAALATMRSARLAAASWVRPSSSSD